MSVGRHFQMTGKMWTYTCHILGQPGGVALEISEIKKCEVKEGIRKAKLHRIM